MDSSLDLQRLQLACKTNGISIDIERRLRHVFHLICSSRKCGEKAVKVYIKCQGQDIVLMTLLSVAVYKLTNWSKIDEHDSSHAPQCLSGNPTLSILQASMLCRIFREHSSIELILKYRQTEKIMLHGSCKAYHVRWAVTNCLIRYPPLTSLEMPAIQTFPQPVIWAITKHVSIRRAHAK